MVLHLLEQRLHDFYSGVHEWAIFGRGIDPEIHEAVFAKAGFAKARFARDALQHSLGRLS
jgi:hypothetical protein